MVIAELRKIADEAQRIHSQSERFGVDAEKLQLLANAAKASGGTLEDVARAMNQLATQRTESARPNHQTSPRDGAPNLSAKAFAAASADENFFMLADAYKQSAQDGQAYADVAELVGRKNTA